MGGDVTLGYLVVLPRRCRALDKGRRRCEKKCMSLLKAKNLNVITAVIIKMYILTWFTEIYAVLLQALKVKLKSKLLHI